jgi:RES domain-containing protein
MDRDMIPATYQLLRVAVPADIAVETVDAELLSDWRSQILTSREIGDRWLDRSSSALFRVPSAISAKGNNYLLNPEHPEATKIAVAEIIKAPFDPRLLA